MIKKQAIVFTIFILMLTISACSKSSETEGTNNEHENNSGEITNSEIKDNEVEEQNEPPQNGIDNTDDTSEEIPNQDENDVTGNNNDDQVDESVTVLVNKVYSLTKEDVPDDLVTVDVPTILDNPEVNQLRKVAADALKVMFEEAKKDGILLYARSGYRSYQTQEQLFKNYASRNGEEAANRYSARAGQSEHQTGLVMDVTSKSVNFQLTEKFGETKEGKWVSENAHKFGFIIRYPKGKEHITGYIYEPWHLRYLGIDLATKVYDSGLTYEEYLEEEGIIHES